MLEAGPDGSMGADGLSRYPSGELNFSVHNFGICKVSSGPPQHLGCLDNSSLVYRPEADFTEYPFSVSLCPPNLPTATLVLCPEPVFDPPEECL